MKIELTLKTSQTSIHIDQEIPFEASWLDLTEIFYKALICSGYVLPKKDLDNVLDQLDEDFQEAIDTDE